MLTLNYRDTRPIYEQIYDGLRRLILTGGIALEEKLPSVRELASELAINPNTIQRAYRELEQVGYIYTVSGKGAYCAGLAHAAEGRKTELLAQLDETVQELKLLGVELEEAIERLRTAWQGQQSEGEETTI